MSRCLGHFTIENDSTIFRSTIIGGVSPDTLFLLGEGTNSSSYWYVGVGMDRNTDGIDGFHFSTVTSVS